MKKILDKKSQKLYSKLDKLQKQEKRLQDVLDNITSSKAYSLWRHFNSIKYFLIHLPSKTIKLFFKSFISLAYFLIIFSFYVFTYFIFLLSRPFVRKLKISNQQHKLDGISFIIPSWNKEKMLITCLKKLLLAIKNTSLKTEIIVIDNGSIDNTSASVKKLFQKSNIPLNLITQKKNIGFARAINLGVKNASYNYIFLLNNDMLVKKNFLLKLINFSKKLIKNKKPFFGISSQIFFYDKNVRREESGKTYTSFNPLLLNVAHCVNPENLKQDSYTAYPGGGASLINKHLFQKIGNYDHKTYIPLYCEDLDLGWNAWIFGFPSYFCHQSHVIHHHRSSTKNLNQDPDFYLYKNFLVFCQKNYNQPKQFIPHLFFYSLSIIFNSQHRTYAIESFKNLPNTFISKVKTYKFKHLISENKLINFTDFENAKNKKQ